MRGDFCPSFWCVLLAAYSWRNRVHNWEKESCCPSYSSGVFCWLLILDRLSSELVKGKLLLFTLFWCILSAAYPRQIELRTWNAVCLCLFLVCSAGCLSWSGRAQNRESRGVSLYRSLVCSVDRISWTC
jgi:hypothetical protein